jgi:hypothetical protein
MSAPPDPPGAFHQFINSFGSAVGGLGMRGIGLLLNRFGFGQGNNGVTQSVGGWAIDRNGNLIDQRGQGAPLSYSDSRFRHPLYSQSNQGPAAFARNNTAAVRGRNII